MFIGIALFINCVDIAPSEELNRKTSDFPYSISSYSFPKLSSKYIDLLYTKKDLIEDGKNERVNSNGQKLEGYPSYAWLQCEYQECGLILEFANYYDLNMSDARKKDLENIKASLEQQIADYTGSDKDENNKNVG